MSSFDGRVRDHIDRDPYVNGDQVALIEHADTDVQTVAYGAECEEHGALMNGHWHDRERATKAVQDHLDTYHCLHVVEAVNIIRFLARTFLAPEASDPAEVDEAEAEANAAFAALDRFDIKEVCEWIEAQGEDPFGGYEVVNPDAIGVPTVVGSAGTLARP